VEHQSQDVAHLNEDQHQSERHENQRKEVIILDTKNLMLLALVITSVSIGTIEIEQAYADQNDCRNYFGYNSTYVCDRAELCQSQFDRVCSCYETASCDITSPGQFLPGLLSVYDTFDVGGITVGFGSMGLVVIWGLIITILWLSSHNNMLVGIVGTVMVAAYLAGLSTAPGPEFEQALMIGAALLLVSVGIGFYQLISTRLFQPPQ
jgi:hypothetical protein